MSDETESLAEALHRHDLHARLADDDETRRYHRRHIEQLRHCLEIEVEA
jgi:hypothetical protein